MATVRTEITETFTKNYWSLGELYSEYSRNFMPGTHEITCTMDDLSEFVGHIQDSLKDNYDFTYKGTDTVTLPKTTRIEVGGRVYKLSDLVQI